MSLRRYLPKIAAPLRGLGIVLFILLLGSFILYMTEKKQQNVLATNEPTIIKPAAIAPVQNELAKINKEPQPSIKTTSSNPKKVNLASQLNTDRLPSLTGKVPDFAAIKDVKQKKNNFFAWLLEFVKKENSRISSLRERILAYQKQKLQKKPLLPRDIIWLKSLAREYGLSPKRYPHHPEFYPALLRSVDILPPSLVLAQGANESGWGGSRFARDANNLFGQWCYIKGCGLVPLRREKNQNHEVARYNSTGGSVRAFFHNINTHPAYAPLRKLREQLRYEQKPLSGLVLGDMLIPYSQRGKAYVKDIKALIKNNNLSQYDPSKIPSELVKK
ncbi:MAG: glucosaminidase domain-containing protein [Magnetococcales bacterium]|nr:glucosaminidase domain-containing protein [Magnetococcales bacterium]